MNAPQTPQAKDKLALGTAIVGLATAILSLGTAIAGLIATTTTGKKLAETEAELKALKNCRNQVAIRISAPESTDTNVPNVTGDIDVLGESTPHETCYVVLVIAHNVTNPGAPWTIEDVVLVNSNGKWAGRVRTGAVPPGSTVEIEARVLAHSSLYVVNQSLRSPPEEGVRSNTVKVRRVK